MASLNGRHRYRAKDSTINFSGSSNNIGHYWPGTQSTGTGGFDSSISGAIALSDGVASKPSHLVVIHPAAPQSSASSVRSMIDSKSSHGQHNLDSEEVPSTTVEVEEGKGGSHGRKASVSLMPQQNLVVLVETEVHRERFSSRRT